MPSFADRVKLVALLGAFSILGLAAPGKTCGPEFPDRFLLGRPAVLSRLPEAKFAREIDRLTHDAHAKTPAVRARVEADLEDLEAAMGGSLTQALRVEYAAARSEGEHVGPLPKGLPSELRLYAEGAARHREKDKDGARAKWEALMKLPEADRKNKTVWASFMLGTLESGDAAVARYRETRALAKKGFADRFALARESLGREAHEELGRGRIARAVELYLEEDRLGGPDAAASLREVAFKIVRLPLSEREALYADPRVLDVVAAYLASRNDETLADKTSKSRRALDHAASHAREKDLEGGRAHLAWAMVRVGEMEIAKALVEAAKPSPLASYVKAKLALRAGDKKRAARELVRAVEALPPSEAPEGSVSHATLDLPSRARGELGILELSRGKLAHAMQLFLDAGSWRDAAYVGERVMTVAELRSFVEQRPSAPPAPTPDGVVPQDVGRDLRWLLARRLVREGRAKEALPFVPKEHVRALAALLDARRRSELGDPKDRAEALFEAARIERHRGLELLGTEVGPDWRLDDGQFDEGGEEKTVGAAEARRRAASRPAKERRFHYRYVAADTAVRAADLAPRDRARQMLCVAHRWHVRDAAEQKRLVAALRARKLAVTCEDAGEHDGLPDGIEEKTVAKTP